jgi:transposase-like protein
MGEDMSIRMVDIGWAAGFLEGEGSFSLLGGIDPRVTAVQVELGPLEKLVALFGGKIYPKKPAGFGKKPVNYWNIGGSHAASLMMTLYPLMSTKRKREIHKAISHWRTTGAKFGALHYSAVMSDKDAVDIVKRVLSGESMTSVSREFGISHATISMWMKGASRPEIRELLGPLADKIKINARGQNHYLVTVSDDDAIVAMRRARNGETHYKIAKELGVSQDTFSFWMRGVKRPYLLARLEQESLTSKEVP